MRNIIIGQRGALPSLLLHAVIHSIRVVGMWGGGFLDSGHCRRRRTSIQWVSEKSGAARPASTSMVSASNESHDFAFGVFLHLIVISGGIHILSPGSADLLLSLGARRLGPPLLSRVEIDSRFVIPPGDACAFMHVRILTPSCRIAT